MAIEQTLYGIKDGKEVYCYTLDNRCGLKAEILSLGGIIKNLWFDGVDVVLGHADFDGYNPNGGCYGAAIGRNANRIAKSEITLNGVTYTLAKNDNDKNNLHGGNIGWDKKVWDCTATDGEEPKLVLKLVSPHMDEGFPGEVHVTMTYTLTKDNAIEIHYEAETDRDTIVNMTNHSYFNLNGHASGCICGHTLQMNSKFYTPVDEYLIPTGEILKTEGTGFDFTVPRTMGDAFEALKPLGGIDHNFILEGEGMRLCATLKGDKTGITMETYTDLPAVQIYTANLDEGVTLPNNKDGATYGNHQAICLETQVYPDAPHYSHFPSSVLKKGEKYDTVTKYKFTK